MPNRKNNPLSFNVLFWHWKMGTCVGLAGAVLLAAIDPQALNALVYAPSAPFSALDFLGFTALVFGAGATLTGMLLLVSEDN